MDHMHVKLESKNLKERQDLQHLQSDKRY